MSIQPPSQAKAAVSGRQRREQLKSDQERQTAERSTRPTPPPLAPPPGQRQRGRFRFRFRYVFLLLLLWLVFLVVVPLIAWNKVSKVEAMPSGDRPGDQPGTTYLLVGSDSTSRPLGRGAQGARHRRRQRSAHRHDHAAAHRLGPEPADVDPPRLAGRDPRPRHEQDQRGLRVRRPAAAGPDHREEHRHQGRQLRRDRLRRLRGPRRRRRRDRDLSQGGHGRRGRQPPHQEGLPGGRRRGRPRVRAVAARPGARGPRPRRPPARGRLGGRQRGGVALVGHQPLPLVEPQHGRRRLREHRRGHRSGDRGQVRGRDDPGRRRERPHLRRPDLRPRRPLGRGPLRADVPEDPAGRHRQHRQGALLPLRPGPARRTSRRSRGCGRRRWPPPSPRSARCR